MSDATKRLAGRVALVSGGARGIGAAIVERLASEGATVFAGDVLHAETEKLAQRLGPSVIAHRLDVTLTGDWVAVMDAVSARFGRLDILVNNAGIYAPASLEAETEAGFRRLFDINQFAVFWGMKSAVPLMGAQGGSIINLSSIGGHVGYNGTFGYAATKWAVRGMTRSAARELAPKKIRVNSVSPGVIDTAMFYENDPELAGQFLATVPAGKLGRPQDIASAVAFLASDEAAYISGTDIMVDGAILA
jgi:3alpha(or 20beta)-hydroxysteroid dehydrogenase